MTKKEFLEKADENLLGYYVSDVYYEDGSGGIEVFLKVGKSDKQIETELENIPAEDLSKNPKISFYEYEISLTKKELQYLLAEIENAEENGVDYDDEDE